MKGAPFVECAGWGLATPLGTSMPSTWAALMQGRYITDHATVPLAADDTPRTTQLGLHVAREAITAVGWSAGDLRDDQTALVIGTSKGPIVNWLTPSGSPQPSGGITGGLSQIATDLAGGLNLGHGPRLTLSAACASGLHALIRAVMLLHFGHATRAVVVAVESSVHPLFLASFQRLGVLPKRGNRCRPFDLRRDGFLMSEAAAAVCLETTDEPGSRCIYVDRFALGGAAGHLTAGDKDGTLWRRLLSRVIGQNPVDLIHAHATGTVLHDPIELAAIEGDEARVTREELPKFLQDLFLASRHIGPLATFLDG